MDEKQLSTQMKLLAVKFCMQGYVQWQSTITWARIYVREWAAAVCTTVQFAACRLVWTRRRLVRTLDVACTSSIVCNIRWFMQQAWAVDNYYTHGFICTVHWCTCTTEIARKHLLVQWRHLVQLFLHHTRRLWRYTACRRDNSAGNPYSKSPAMYMYKMLNAIIQ